MDSTVISAVQAFATDARTQTLVGLVFLDLLFGVASAMRLGTFQAGLVGNWYIKTVFPYVIVYAGLYGIAMIGIAQVVSPLVGDIAAYASAAPAAVSLVDSIQRNMRTLAQGAVPTPDA
jgi:hypothetical protein